MAGRVLGISLQSVEVPGAEQLERAFAEITRGRPTARSTSTGAWSTTACEHEGQGEEKETPTGSGRDV